MEYYSDLLVDTRTAWALEVFDHEDVIEDDKIIDENKNITNEKSDNVSGDLRFTRHTGGPPAGPSSTVSDSNVLDDNSTIHVGEAKVLESSTLRLLDAVVEGDGSSVRCLPFASLVLFVGVTY